MPKKGSFESRHDHVSAKVIQLNEATRAVVNLLSGEPVPATLDDSGPKPYWRGHEPDWEKVETPLLKLTEFYDLDCYELAQILTTAGINKYNPVREASHWLTCVKNIKDVEDFPGKWVLEMAVESGDTRFFIRLGEHLKNLARKRIVQAQRKKVSWVRLTLGSYWQPHPDLNWPGLAYCKSSAQWQFFQILKPELGEKHDNYLDNERRYLGLIRSENCFVSKITGAPGNFHFS